MKNLGRQQEVYLNCQKVKLLSNMKSKECLKEEIFHTGIIELYLDESNINRLKSGDIIDSCCYFFAEPKTTRQGGQFYL